MADTYANTIIANSTWRDLTVTYAPSANTSSWVQNRGGKNILVAFSSSASAPNDGGLMLRSAETAIGRAAHIWVKVLGDTGSVSIGVAD